jgi:uncharacterized protein with PQ loop repeat
MTLPDRFTPSFFLLCALSCSCYLISCSLVLSRALSCSLSLVLLPSLVLFFHLRVAKRRTQSDALEWLKKSFFVSRFASLSDVRKRLKKVVFFHKTTLRDRFTPSFFLSYALSCSCYLVSSALVLSVSPSEEKLRLVWDYERNT